MGCAQSKIDNEEAVARCKDRRNFMKEAVGARNAFASAHSGYAVALKNTGAALSDYAQGEAPPPQLVVGGGGGAVNDIASEPPPPPPPPMTEANLPPPPPPLPNFSPATPLLRAMTMPAALSQPGIKMKEIDGIEEEQEEQHEGGESVGGFRRKEHNRRKESKGVGNEAEETPMKAQAPPPPPPENKGMAWDYFFNVEHIPGGTLDELEEEEDEEEEDEEDFMEEHNVNQKNNFGGVHGNAGDLNDGANFKTPQKLVMRGTENIMEEMTPVTPEKQFMHSNTAPSGIRGGIVGGTVGGGSGNSVDLLKVLSDIDDHFLKASESAQEVSKMLEATRLHYHSNFADNRGHIDHAARVMRVITWNKSFRGVPNGEGGIDEYDAEEYETHATVLDKLLAWEKKLYEEVKTGELMKLEYQRKVSVLNRLKKRNSSSTESVEKAKAAVSHLHTRYIVDMQSLDSTVAEVNDIRDKQLYPKLVALADGMAKMWESMLMHHNNQLKIVTELRSLDVSGCPKETSEYHHDRTSQLLRVVDDWRLQFEKLVAHQKHYINALNSWLKLNLIPIESSLKEKISSPLRTQNPPIQPLLNTWHECLEKLPDEHTKSAITSFSAVIKTILLHQEEEMKLKEKCEETRKEFIRKSQAFDDWYHKYMRHRTPPDEGDPDRVTDSSTKDPITEKQFVVESLKKRLEEEEEDHRKHCLQVREKSIGNLKIRLPELFRAMSDYSNACSEAFHKLRELTRSQVPNGARPHAISAFISHVVVLPEFFYVRYDILQELWDMISCRNCGI
ncbi:hypothetical protein Leryth_011309 [Lithospermum erythrorhizon]|nr:hypothetical protein Leryth_011309 [Lithospermum erythrorhizon]